MGKKFIGLLYDNFGTTPLGIVMLVAASFVALSFVFYPVYKGVCRDHATGMGLGYDYSFLGGCKVRINDGTLIPLKNYRYVDTNK